MRTESQFVEDIKNHAVADSGVLQFLQPFLDDSWNWLACNLWTRIFIAQSVEHHTGIAEVMGSNPIGASEFFLGFICNCLSYFTTAKISFTPKNLVNFTKSRKLPTLICQTKSKGVTMKVLN